MNWKILPVLLTLVLTGVFCQNEAPRFNLDMNELSLPEDTELGEVYRLMATDPEGQRLYYGIIADMFEVRNSQTGIVFLTRQLDYLNEPQLRARVWVSEADNVNRVERNITVRVLDANNRRPVFSQETYKTTVQENAAIGSTVLANIIVTDVDTVGTTLHVRCINHDSELARDACNVFGLQEVSSNNRRWEGHLILRQSVDFERRAMYQVPLEAWDGTNRQVQTVEVTVQNVQERPPQFISSLTATLPESARPGTPVLQVTAIDADPGSTREIRYTLIDNPNNLFTIDPVTGQITLFGDLNREGLFLQSGFVTLTVQAAKVMGDGSISTSPDGRAQTQVTISVLDSNDNAPLFNPINYYVNVSEDIRDNEPITGLSMSVSDPDQGANSVFELRLLDYTDIFEVFPRTASRSTTANIRVINSNRIDYDQGQKSYVVRVRAQETQTANRQYSDATVYINLWDENDNAPQFAQDSYDVTISELAPGGTSVITITATDIDSGIYGQEGLRYKLVGNNANKFDIDTQTGLVTVRDCPTPGSGNCIDFEQDQVFSLTFWAGDNYAEGYTTSVPLRIHIRDENDNEPRFRIPNYIGYIRDGDTIPRTPNPLQVVADDADQNSRIVYSIVGGNQAGLWQIGDITGVITATRPVRYSETPGRLGRYDLTISASDGRYTATGQVTIYVEQGNNFPPVFTQNGYYEQTILESTPPDTVIETVTALDQDPPNSPNGQVRYRIQSGARGMFVLSENSGVIRVASGVKFDYDQQRRYEMIVIASDQGSPQRTATATVVVNIEKVGGDKPIFSPSRVEVDIYENATINSLVVQMTATDPDNSGFLQYRLEDPWQAWDGFRQAVNVANYDFRTLFRIDSNSGAVLVNRQLNFDRAARVSMQVRATDPTGEFGLATLIINILDLNTDPPTFIHPWTPQNPTYRWSILEEQPIGSYINTLVATDPTDSIEYRITSDPQGFFSINSRTGVVTITRRMDYEQIQNTRFIAVAVDNGSPPQTATATVYVDIVNINDNIPVFSEVYYDVDLPENSPPGSTVVTITATDRDLGDYGVVRYVSPDPRFIINERTGVVTIAPGVILDREEIPDISITITAYDSPLDPSVRRQNSVPVIIRLRDENDQVPRFTHSTYNATIVDSTPPGTSVVQVTATDDDEGPNGEVRYVITGGTGTNMFTIDTITGLISTRQRLTGYAGSYDLTIQANDRGSPQLTSISTVYITVIEANNNRPEWENPKFNNLTIEVLEDQYLGMEITTVTASDPDGNVVSYNFYYNNQYTTTTPDFKINPITGVISANQIFDRETRDTYILHLVARDNGIPILDADRYLTIRILDVDDHDPEFPIYANCCVIPARFNVSEDAKVNTFVGRVNATDRDIGQFANTKYSIIRGNIGNTFTINETTGEIFTTKLLDREVLQVYVLRVKASNQGSDASRSSKRRRPGCASGCDDDPSEIDVYIYLIDINDNPPKFDNKVYNACIPIDAQMGHSVMSMTARDIDIGSGEITYSLQSIRSHRPGSSVDPEPARKDMFAIGTRNGTIYSQDLMSFHADHYFSMTVLASDGTNTGDTRARVWVTESSKQVTLTLRATVNVVRSNLDCLVDYLSQITGGGIVCVSELRNHIPENSGDFVMEWTDMTFHVIDGDKLVVMNTNDIIALIEASDKDFCLLGIEDLEATAAVWGGFIIDPVLAAILLIILLLLLALLLLCCICFCLEKWYKRSIFSRYLVEPWGIPTETKAKLYEDQELRMTVEGEAKDGVDNAAFTGDGVARLALNTGIGGETRTETTQEYSMNYESTRYTQNAVGTLEGTPSIVAPLEGRDQADGPFIVAPVGGAPASRSYSAMSATGSAGGPSSLREPSLHSPTGIGATLSSSYRDVSMDGFTVLRGVRSVDAQSDFDHVRSWPRNQANSLSGSAPPSYHSYDLGRDTVVHDIPIDSAQPYTGEEFPDGMYQGEILLGSFRPPRSRSVPPAEYSQPMSLVDQQLSRSHPHLLDAGASSYHGGGTVVMDQAGFSHSQPNLANNALITTQPIMTPLQQQQRMMSMTDRQYREEHGGGPGYETHYSESREYTQTQSHGYTDDVY